MLGEPGFPRLPQVPLREHSHLNLQYDRTPMESSSTVGLDNRICPGCQLSAVTENGGLVVAFGQSFFHVDCFKCAKCGDKVTADTNLLLLSDGSPICANCSYSCNICHLPILDEAIMTGDDSYHAHCFNCKVCKNRIDELVFAKTSQGIYCMSCHNERTIKIRAHAQRKAEREKAGGGSSSKSRKQRPPPAASDVSEFGGRTTKSSGSGSHSSRNHPDPRPGNSRRPEEHRQASPRHSGPYVSDAFEAPPPQQNGTPKSQPQTPPTSAPQRLSVTVAPPLDLSHTPTSQTTPRPLPPTKSPLPLESHDGGRRYDDGIRPLDVLFKQSTEPPDKAPEGGLNVATSRRDKRRSINPGLVLTGFSRPATPPQHFSPSLSPNSATATFQAQQQASGPRSQTPPSLNGRESPRSPFRDQFSTDSSPSTSRPISHSSSYHSYRSSSSSLSPIRVVEELNDHTITGSSQHQTRTSPTSAAEDPPAGRSSSEHIPYVPPRTDSLGRASPSLTLNGSIIRPQRSFDERPHRTSSHSSDSKRSRSVSRTRAGSRADVPHSVESETDTDSENPLDREHDLSRPRSAPADKMGFDSPPALPTKASHERNNSGQIIEAPAQTSPPGAGFSPITSEPEGDGSVSDASESSPVERVSHSTFIAPALPPIRFSMNSADFSDLLSSVGGQPSLRQLAQLSEASELTVPATPPPTAVPLPTPTMDTVTPKATDDSGKIRSMQSSAELHDDDLRAPRGGATPNDHERYHSTFNHDSTPKRSQESNSSPQLPQRPPLTNGKSSSYSERRVPTPIEVLNHSSTAQLSRTMSESSRAKSKRTIDSKASSSTLNDSPSTRITLTEPDSSVPRTLRQDPPDLVLRRLQEAVADADQRGAQQLKLDRTFVEAILAVMESRSAEVTEMKGNMDGMKRTSRQYIEGLTVAQEEYDKELKSRRDAEAEVTRLRVLLSGQVARLTALSGDSRRQELREQLSKELNESLTGLEHDLSKLRVERDMTLAEVEELSASKSAPGLPSEPSTGSGNLGRSLTMRLDKIKTQYKHELVPLTEQREALNREIQELKGVRDVFLEETTVLNARNEELAQLSAQYARRMDVVPEPLNQRTPVTPALREQKSATFDKTRTPQQPGMTHSLSSSTAVSSQSVHSEESVDSARYMKIHKIDAELTTPQKPKNFIKWPGSKVKEATPIAVHAVELPKTKGNVEGHMFQQLSVLRFTRCDQCNEKMWGSQLRCSVCSMSIHVRCATHVHSACHQSAAGANDTPRAPPPPSMFGRLLTEQVRADANGDERQVPVIVEKCIDAVEILALDYEGIYRKSGGSGQTKAITSLFERGDYDSFDLRDSDRFNDICSITSVLKTYFRSLPVPLLTYDLHERFMTAVSNRDIPSKNKTLLDLVRSLPSEHYYTLRMLMLHLNHIRERSEVNLMNARNLGVVFGPTLMRSADPGAEFSDMAGKALSIEWLVENAPFIFNEPVSH